jgi:hypothetical protein
LYGFCAHRAIRENLTPPVAPLSDLTLTLSVNGEGQGEVRGWGEVSGLDNEGLFVL